MMKRLLTDSDCELEELTYEQFQATCLPSLPLTKQKSVSTIRPVVHRTTVEQARSRLMKMRSSSTTQQIAAEKQLKKREDGWKVDDNQQLVQAKLASKRSKRQENLIAENIVK